MAPLAANASGFAVGLLSSFFINGSFTFRRKVPLIPGLASFFAVVACGYAANTLVLVGTTQWCDINPYVAQVLGMGTYVVFVFFGCERLVYTET